MLDGPLAMDPGENLVAGNYRDAEGEGADSVAAFSSPTRILPNKKISFPLNAVYARRNPLVSDAGRKAV